MDHNEKQLLKRSLRGSKSFRHCFNKIMDESKTLPKTKKNDFLEVVSSLRDLYGNTTINDLVVLLNKAI